MRRRGRLCRCIRRIYLCTLRLSPTAAARPVALCPGRVCVYIGIAYRVEWRDALTYRSKMGEDACSYCNSRNPSIKCFVAAWTPPNPLTGEYPHLGPDGEEETILHRGCLTCTVMGRTCSKLGQQLYPLDGNKVSRTCFTRDLLPERCERGPERNGEAGE